VLTARVNLVGALALGGTILYLATSIVLFRGAPQPRSAEAA
jgi:hypothetical protein